MLSIEEAKKKIIDTAATNKAFRKMLIDDPQAAVKTLFKAEIPDGTTIHIHEETADELHTVLPPVNTEELSQIELDAVAGGTCWDYEEPIPCDFNY